MQAVFLLLTKDRQEDKDLLKAIARCLYNWNSEFLIWKRVATSLSRVTELIIWPCYRNSNRANFYYVTVAKYKLNIEQERF